MYSTRRKPRESLIKGDSHGRPLDFSFRKIQFVKDILRKEPRQGKRLPIPDEEETEDPSNNAAVPVPKENNSMTQQSEEKEEEEQPQVKKQEEAPLKPPPEQEINKVYQTHIVSFQSQAKTKTEEEKQASVQKCHVKLYTSSLILCNNYLQAGEGLVNIIRQVMIHPEKLGWIDLSHNLLQTIPEELSQVVNLKSLYLHANYFWDLHEVTNLQQCYQLRSLTLYGAPFETIPHYRLYVLAALPQLVKLDSAVVTALEWDNAEPVHYTFFSEANLQSRKRKKLPRLKEPPKVELPEELKKEIEEAKEEEKEQKNSQRKK